MMGLRWQWPWGLFSQSERCEMMAGGGGEMVGPLRHSSDHGGGLEMVRCVSCSFGWSGQCEIAVGRSCEGMEAGGCGE